MVRTLIIATEDILIVNKTLESFVKEREPQKMWAIVFCRGFLERFEVAEGDSLRLGYRLLGQFYQLFWGLESDFDNPMA